MENPNKSGYQQAIDDFKFFQSIGLYGYGSAQESYEYNLRIQRENYLKYRGIHEGHSEYITPILYGDETKSRNTLIENYFEEDEDGMNKNIDNVTYKFFNEFHDVTLRILVVDDKIGDCIDKCYQKIEGNYYENETRKSIEIYKKITADDIEFYKYQKFNDQVCDDKGNLISFDDPIYIKLNGEEWQSYINSVAQKGQTISIFKCESCYNTRCKLKTLRQLMDKGTDTNKDAIFEGIGNDKDYFYWKEDGIDTYFCPVTLNDFIRDESISIDNLLSIKFEGNNKKKSKPDFVCFEKSSPNVQLIGVRDVRTALLLLSRYKFDMIFFDYLLDYKDSNRSKRDYSIQFFDFLTGNVIEKTINKLSGEAKKTKEEVEAKKTKEEIEEKKTKLERAKILEKFRREVLDNRGPLDRFWIMPITGFNETFITDLSRSGIPLIGSKWHINNGADPITTPWQFLDKLNRFIELQLTGSLFTLNKLLTFLQYTGEDLETKFRVEEKKKSQEPNTKISFGEFQAFLSAEYSSFFSKYGSKAVIKRDAVTTEDEKDWSSKSVFATYIWKNFYRNREGGSITEEREKKQLFGLHSHMLGFYQMAAIMHNDRHGMLMLRESFRRLRYFIDVNRLVDETRAKIEKESFKKAVETIADCIDLVERGKNGSNL